MFNITIVIYSLIYVAVYSFVTDHTHTQNQNMAATIFTKKADIIPIIHTHFNRTATYWSGRGSYSGAECYVIYTALSKYEAMKLKTIIKHEDPDAFIVFSDIHNIFGRFDKHLDD